MKKGFTIVEILLTLAIILIILGFLLPTLKKATPDENAVKYRNAYYSLAGAVANILAEPDASENLDNTTSNVCTSISQQMSTITKCSSNTFTTSNNMVYTFPATWTATTPSSITICVDVNGTDKGTNTGCSASQTLTTKDQFRIMLYQDGKVTTGSDWTVENNILSNPTKIKK